MCAMSLTHADSLDDTLASGGQHLIFTLGAESYGINILHVREIKAWSETTRLPNTPEHLRGVMNLRGQIIPIYDLNTPFHGAPTLIGNKHVVIILNVADRTIGLVVDAVSDLIELSADEIKPAPTEEMGGSASFVHGLVHRHEQMIVLLDVTPLVDGSFTSSHSALAS